MAENNDNAKMVDAAKKSIYKANETTIPTGEFAYQTFHETILNKVKQEIIQERGMEGATKYLNGKEGQQYLSDEIIARSHSEAVKKLSGANLSKGELSTFASIYIPNAQRLAQGIGEAGSKFHYGNFEKVLEPNIKQNETALAQTIGQFDKAAIPYLLNSIGLNKFLKNYDGISPMTAGQLVSIDNKGGSPLGPDMLRRIGLEDRLKDAYKK